MDNTLHLFGLYFGLDFVGLCSGHPIDPKELSSAVPLEGPLLGFLLLAVSIVCLAACACCRQQQRKGFKEFTDSTSNQSLNHVGRGFTNPGLTPGSELSIFPPLGAVTVAFEPLPNIVPARSRKPPAYNNVVADGLSDTDWFMGPQIDFPRHQLHYLRECGRGWFGRAVEGEAKGLKDNSQTKVVVKILREDATQAEQKFFLNEVKPYRDLNHNNVLKLVGRCLETNPYLILLEACTSGDLKSFLAGNITSSAALVQQGVCLRMMCQVASGLQHMIQHGFVHTDLAARNCLVTSDLTVKVGDYGTSIETFKNDYYITEDVAIPIRWCSPETLHCTDTTIETKPVTVSANIWSLGVVLWEICEFGCLPYSELSDDQVIVKVLCQEGIRLGCPSLHTLHNMHLYTLMQMCWQMSSKRPSIEHILAMLLHLQTSTVSDTDEDFERRWETLKPNSIPITDNHVPEVTLEALTIKSDFDSGVDLEIKATDPEAIDVIKKLSIEGVNRSPSITASPQLSVTSSSGGEFFTSSGLSTMQRHLSPSMTNLRGSVEDITKHVEDRNETVTEEFDSWLKGVDTTSEEDVKFVRKISEAIKDLDDALALEKTSSSEGSSRQESPLKDSVVSNENPVLDFRLGPIAYKDSGMQLDSLQEDSLIRRDSSTDTEEETWRGRIERGEFSEKVKEKSKSVTDLMVLTHIENSDGSDESDSLPSLTRQYSIEKVKRYGYKPSLMMTSIGFGSEGNIRGAVLGEEFQESLKQLQAEWRMKESESHENSLLVPETSTLLQKDKMDFLSNDASEKTNLFVDNSQTNNIVNTAIVPSQRNVNIVQKNSSVPILKSDCVQDVLFDGSMRFENTSNLYSKISSFIDNEKAFTSNLFPVLNESQSNRIESSSDANINISDLEVQNTRQDNSSDTNIIISDLEVHNIRQDNFVLKCVLDNIDIETKNGSGNIHRTEECNSTNQTNTDLTIDVRNVDMQVQNIEGVKTETLKHNANQVNNSIDKTIDLNNISQTADCILSTKHTVMDYTNDISDESENHIQVIQSKNIKPTITNFENNINTKNITDEASHKIINAMEKIESESNLIDNVKTEVKEYKKELSNIDDLTKQNSTVKISDVDSVTSLTNKTQENNKDITNTKEESEKHKDNSNDVNGSEHDTREIINCNMVGKNCHMLQTTNLKETNENIMDINESNNCETCDEKEVKVLLLSELKDKKLEKTTLKQDFEVPILKEFNKLDEKFHNSVDFTNLKSGNTESEREVLSKIPTVSGACNISDDFNSHNINLSSIHEPPESKPNCNKILVDSESIAAETEGTDYAIIKTTADSSVVDSNKAFEFDTRFLSDEKMFNNFVPEIVVTEASILDIDSEPEETLHYQNEIRPRRKIRIMVSSSDESEDELESNKYTFSEQELTKSADCYNFSNSVNDKNSEIVSSTSCIGTNRNCKNIIENDIVPNAEHEYNSTETFVVPLSSKNKFSMKDENEMCVILGSCEDYTLDYFKGLKTTFGKPTVDVIDPLDDLSKSDDENEVKEKHNWNEFLSQALVDSEEKLVYSDVTFCSNIVEKNGEINCESDKTCTKAFDDMELSTRNDTFIVNEKLMDVNKDNGNSDECPEFGEIGYSDKKCENEFPQFKVKNVEDTDTVSLKVDKFNGLNSKDLQMEEVKNRLEDVAKFSQGFCLKGSSTSVEDEEDGKFLTPDDERSSDSGFRDKGSLSESVEDACDEKYNLEDIEAELEEVYSKNNDLKSDQDPPNSSDDQEKTYILTEQCLQRESVQSNPVHEVKNEFDLFDGDDNTNNIELHKSDRSKENEMKLNKNEVSKFLESEELFCLSSEIPEKSVDFLNKSQVEDRFNKLDSALDSNIDLFFETDEKDNKVTNSGWYLHPPVTEKSTYLPPTNEQSNGWLPAPILTEDTSKDNSYVSFHIDEEFVTAIRNELREKLPCAQNPERQDSEDEFPEEERTDMVIQYNTYPAPLSPIYEERESLSSNQSSLLLDDQKSSDTSGKSSPVLFLDLPKEIENLFEDDIRNEMDVDSDSTESDTAVIVVEDLEDKEVMKVSENVKDDCDDLLIIDTETNCATLLESPKPKSQLAFVKQIQNDDEISSGVDSDTFVLARLDDESDKQTFNHDSVSPLSTGSSRTGAAISFSSSETGSLSGFYLSPSSVRSDLFDSGPPSLPFDFGVFDKVEEISIKPNNEAAEIVQELVDIGVLKQNDLVTADKTEYEIEDGVWDVRNNLQSEIVDNEIKVGDKVLQNNKMLTSNKEIPNHKDSLEILISSNKSTVESLPVQSSPESQNWLQSVLLPDVQTIITKDDSQTKPVSLTTDGWPSVDELIPSKNSLENVKFNSKLENDLTPESPLIDINEIVGKCDINSTLALSTPNFSILSDESKDNSQLSSFSSTPTTEVVKSISDKFTKDSIIENSKYSQPKSVVPLSVLAESIVNNQVRSNEKVTVTVEDVTPEEERERKLQGMTLALEPMIISKAPMPSPEDADKGLWRPTIGQLLELTNQQIEQDDMMTTSFIDADNNDGERYTPDWESDTSDESEHSSSSGEFIWKEGGREEAVKAVLASTSDLQSQDTGEEEDEGRDDSSCGSTTEFVPSSWDSNATPTKTALRSAEKTSSEKKKVSFKLQKYHCVYEYPKEASESEDEDEDELTRRRSWQTPTFDYSTYADWELGEGEVEVEGEESDTEEGALASPVKCADSSHTSDDFYRLSGMDFDVGYMTSEDGEFYISSSAKPFHQFMTDDGSGSEFFPGASTDVNDDDFIVEFNPLASDLQPVLIDGNGTSKTDEMNIIPDKKTYPTKPNNLYIPPEPSPSEESSSAEVSPGLGELRHTRQRLRLDLLGAIKGVAETVKGEASLLDSGEDSGIESNGQCNGQVRLKDSVESSSEA